MWLSYLRLTVKRHLIIFEHDEVIDILVWLPSNFRVLKKSLESLELIKYRVT